MADRRTTTSGDEGEAWFRIRDELVEMLRQSPASSDALTAFVVALESLGEADEVQRTLEWVLARLIP